MYKVKILIFRVHISTKFRIKILCELCKYVRCKVEIHISLGFFFSNQNYVAMRRCEPLNEYPECVK